MVVVVYFVPIRSCPLRELLTLDFASYSRASGPQWHKSFRQDGRIRIVAEHFAHDLALLGLGAGLAHS